LFFVWLTGGKLGPLVRNTISVDQKMAEIKPAHSPTPVSVLTVFRCGGRESNSIAASMRR
jgi:hypothetical protein